MISGRAPGKFLIAVDGSAHCRSALQALETRLWGAETEFTIVSVVDHGPVGGRLSLEQAKELTASAGSQLKDKLNIEAKIEILAGRPADELLQFCKVYKPDYVVLGAHSRDGIDKMLFGSVTDEIAKKTNHSLIVGRHKPQTKDGSPAPSPFSVVICLSKPKSAYQVLDTIAGQPWRTDTRFILLRSFAPPVKDYSPNVKRDLLLFHEEEARIRRSLEDSLNDMAEHLKEKLPGHLIEHQVLEWLDAQEALLIACRKVKADLLMLGEREHTGWDELIGESLSKAALDHAPCSIEIVRSLAVEL